MHQFHHRCSHSCCSLAKTFGVGADCGLAALNPLSRRSLGEGGATNNYLPSCFPGFKSLALTSHPLQPDRFFRFILILEGHPKRRSCA